MVYLVGQCHADRQFQGLTNRSFLNSNKQLDSFRFFNLHGFFSETSELQVADKERFTNFYWYKDRLKLCNSTDTTVIRVRLLNQLDRILICST